MTKKRLSTAFKVSAAYFAIVLHPIHASVVREFGDLGNKGSNKGSTTKVPGSNCLLNRKRTNQQN
jgi:hypothetical protein